MNESRYGLGFAYVNLYRLGFDINQAVQPLSVNTFGATDITVRQASLLLSTALNHQLALGATLDVVWTNVDCSYATCVDFGSMGLGATVGLAYDVVRTVVQRIAVSGLWRARATLRYIDAPSSSIGAVLDQYIPDRPQTLGIGAHGQFSTRYAAINVNATCEHFSCEHISWSSASAPRASSPDFDKLGLGGEMVMPISGTISIAARLGATHARAKKDDAVANVYALGAGITWGGGHGINIALGRRAQKNSTADEINHVSFAYSWQR